MRKPLSLMAMVIAATTLSACAGGTPAATNSPQPSATTTPAPVETEEPAVATSIIIGAETTDILDQNGEVLVSLRYSEDGDEAVAEATAVLGAPTDTNHDEGSFHSWPSDITSWGEFHISVIRYREEPVGADRNYQPAFRVTARAAGTGAGISVEAVDGTQIGDAFEAAAAGKPEDEVYVDETFGYRSVALELPSSFPGMVEDHPGFFLAYGAIGFSDPGESTITTIVSPTYLFSLT